MSLIWLPSGVRWITKPRVSESKEQGLHWTDCDKLDKFFETTQTNRLPSSLVPFQYSSPTSPILVIKYSSFLNVSCQREKQGTIRLSGYKQDHHPLLEVSLLCVLIFYEWNHESDLSTLRHLFGKGWWHAGYSRKILWDQIFILCLLFPLHAQILAMLKRYTLLSVG